MSTGFIFTLGFFVGLAVMGAIWTVLNAKRNHPGKLEHIAGELKDKLKDRP